MKRSTLALACLLLAGCGMPTPSGPSHRAQLVIGTVASAPVTRSMHGTIASLLADEPISTVASDTASDTATTSPATASAAASTASSGADSSVGPGAAATTAAPTAITPESGTWDLKWQFSGRMLDFTLQMNFFPDGTIGLNGPSDPQATWGAGKADFIGGCGFHSSEPSIFGSCERYAMQVVAPDRMEGTVTFLINLKPIVLPVDGVLEVKKASDCTASGS